MLHDQRKNLLILSFTLVVVMLGYGIVMPIIPFYVEKLGAGGQELGLLVAISALMQLFFAPLWGSLSDRIGRKPVLLVGVLGYGLTMLLFGLSTHLWSLFVARALNGVLSSATLPTAMAYVGDNTDEKQRAGGMGQLGAAMGAGVVLGPGLGGVLASVSLATPFLVASGLCLVALLLVALLLPESLPSGERQPKSAAPAKFDFALLRQLLLGPLGILMLLSLVVSFGMSSFQGILGLYALDKFGFDTRQIGWMWMLVGGVMVFSQGALTGVLIRRWGEVAVIRLSLAATAVGFLGMLQAAAYLSLLLATGFLVLAIALLGPALNSLISSRTQMQQGLTMGLTTSSTSLGRIAGPVWAGAIFDVNISYPFLSGAAILLVGFLISLAGISQGKPSAAPAGYHKP
jgi:DHA1 family multidrug resistance protein-like MFS transporter